MSLYQEFALALGHGLLIGLERPWSAQEAAGIRTFSLTTARGTSCAAWSERWEGWLVAAEQRRVPGRCRPPIPRGAVRWKLWVRERCEHKPSAVRPPWRVSRLPAAKLDFRWSQGHLATGRPLAR